MTFLVHPGQLEHAEGLAFWRGVAADARVLVLPRLGLPGIELAAWLARRPAAGTG